MKAFLKESVDEYLDIFMDKRLSRFLGKKKRVRYFSNRISIELHREYSWINFFKNPWKSFLELSLEKKICRIISCGKTWKNSCQSGGIPAGFSMASPEQLINKSLLDFLKKYLNNFLEEYLNNFQKKPVEVFMKEFLKEFLKESLEKLPMFFFNETL